MGKEEEKRDVAKVDTSSIQSIPQYVVDGALTIDAIDLTPINNSKSTSKNQCRW